MKYDFELDFVNNNSLTWIMDQIKTGTTVLEFGPATGRLTKYMKEDLGCKVYLVEIDEESGKKALQYAEDLLVGDAENYEWLDRYKDLRFDHIIFADVLEHLRNPEELLVQAKRLLKSDGSILLSVPNVAHNSVLINLLNNRFEYTSVGLLDNTHIHLFTKESLENMLNRAGLYVEQRYATYSKVGTNEIINTVEDVPGIDKSYWLSREYGEVYQFVYAVRKSLEYITDEVNVLPSQNRNYYAQVFYDTNDLKEELSEKKYFTKVSQVLNLELDVNEVGKKFRFDPLNGECLVKIHVDGVSILAHNACMQQGDLYIFNTEDPIIECQVIDGTVSKIVISVEYISIDAIVVNVFFNQLSKMMGSNEIQKNEMTNKLVQLEAEKTQLEEAVSEKAQLENEKAQLENEKAQLENEMAQLGNKKTELELESQEMKVQIQHLKEKVDDLQGMCNEKEKLLNDILNSKKWRLINVFGRR